MVTRGIRGFPGTFWGNYCPTPSAVPGVAQPGCSIPGSTAGPGGAGWLAHTYGPQTLPPGGWAAWSQYTPGSPGRIVITLPLDNSSVSGIVPIHVDANAQTFGVSTLSKIDIYTLPPASQSILVGTLAPIGTSTYSGLVLNWDTSTYASGVHNLVAFAVSSTGQAFVSPQVDVTVSNAAGSITITDPLPGTCSSCSGGAVCSLFSGTFDASHPAGINFVQVWQDGVLFDTLDYSAAPPTTITGDGFALDNIPNNSCVTRSMYLVLVPVTGANIQSSTVTATKCNNAPCP